MYNVHMNVCVHVLFQIDCDSDSEFFFARRNSISETNKCYVHECCSSLSAVAYANLWYVACNNESHY
jgi:hypothetical protein